MIECWDIGMMDGAPWENYNAPVQKNTRAV
jgi:hypothetical protein